MSTEMFLLLAFLLLKHLLCANSKYRVVLIEYMSFFQLKEISLNCSNTAIFRIFAVHVNTLVVV